MIKKPSEGGKPVTEKKAHSRYYEAVGRRKTAVARVRITNGSGDFIVNERKFDDYFPLATLRKVAVAPISELQLVDKVNVSVSVKGGGIHAQADSVRHGVARALSLWNPDLDARLRASGFMTRDSRMVERKKYGLRKARRAPQWAKR